jgi:hypothetical protein
MSRNAVDIAFMDLSSMSGPMKAAYLMAIYSVLAGALWWFYRFLVAGPEAIEAEKKAKADAKRAKKAKKS